MKKMFILLSVFFLGFSLSTPRADALCIKEKRANLRQGPGTQWDKKWEVFKFMPFKKLGQKRDWLRVQDVDGDIYWVHKKLTTSKFKCAVVKGEKANFRKGPGTQHAMVPWSPVEKYFSMKVLKIKGKWVHIEDASGDRAWVFKPLVWIR